MCEATGLSPSAKLVAKTLKYEGPLTFGEITEEANLPKSTVADAIDRLEEQDALERRPGPDARSVRYEIA